MQKLAFNLLNLFSDQKNVLYSPASLQLALMRAALGAKGNTRKELLTALGILPETGSSLLASFANDIEARIHEANIHVANALFVEQTYGLNPQFKALFSGESVFPVDFVGNPDGGRKDINKYAADQTQQRILNLLKDGTIDSLTRLVIINAIYLKLQWLYRFDEAETYADEFHLDGGGTTPIPMMHQTNSNLLFYEDQNFKALIMPYTGSNLLRLYVVPQRGVSLSYVEQLISEMGLRDLHDKMATQRDLAIALPKFTMGWGTHNLVPQLKALGVKDAFTQAADFSGMSADAVADLMIDGVYQKAWMEDNELGSEMAVVTAVSTREKAVAMPTSFEANRPFLFFNLIPVGINGNFLPLFVGRLSDPRLI